MKPDRTHSRKPAVITNSRWLAYATAGTASAFTCANSAEATIHYIGIIHEFIGECEDKSDRFQLDQPGDSFRLRHSNFFGCTFSYGGTAYFSIRGRAGAAFAGRYDPCPSAHVVSVSNLNNGQLISTRPFLARNSGLLGRNDVFCH